MKRFALLFLTLAVLVPWRAASAQQCQTIVDPTLRADCTMREALRGMRHQTCALELSELSRSQCMRADLVQLGMDNVCASGELKTDKVACLERKMEILARELADLRRELPKLIEQGVREALEPRVHR